MSLTVTVKDELALVATENAAQRRAEVSAMLRFAGGLHIVSGRIVVEAELAEPVVLAVLVGFINHLGGHGDERVIAGGFGQALDLILLHLSGRRCRGR